MAGAAGEVQRQGRPSTLELAANGVLVALVAVVVGVGVFGFLHLTEDQVAACEARAVEEKAFIVESMRVYDEVKIGDVQFLEQCEIGEEGVLGTLLVPRDVGTEKALTLLGADWVVDADGRAVVHEGSTWEAFVREFPVEGEPVMEVNLHP